MDASIFVAARDASVVDLYSTEETGTVSLGPKRFRKLHADDHGVDSTEASVVAEGPWLFGLRPKKSWKPMVMSGKSILAQRLLVRMYPQMPFGIH
jgi:hypothetical protein